MRIGSIEAGGTKINCGIGNEHGELIETIQFPTTKPEETLENIISYFHNKHIECLGIGSFGPLDLKENSPTYGSITTTPKPDWSNVDIVNTLSSIYNIPIGWDTDVNAAALGEAYWGAAQGLDSCLYYTVGTGIGIGVYIENNLVHGLVHPEGGHILTRRHPKDPFQGICPYHGDCLEGLASGTAIEARWMVKATELPSDHIAWEIEAFYLAQAISTAILTVSPKKIILGGGVMKQAQLFPLIHQEVRNILNGYVNDETITTHIEQYIVQPKLGNNAGLCGGLALGLQAFHKK